MATRILASTGLSLSEGSSSVSLPEEKEVESEDEPFVPPPSSWFENNSHVGAPATRESTQQAEHDLTDSSFSLDDETRHWNASPSATPLPPRTHQGYGTVVIGVPINPTHYTPPEAIGNTHPSPSWREISSQVLPAAAKELLSSSWRRVYYTAKLSYAKGRWQRKYSDLGNNAGGIYLGGSSNLPFSEEELPPFSSLSWVDRQLVREWRTYLPSDGAFEEDPDEDFDFDRARALVPSTFPRPKWQKADVCHQCHKPFGPTRLRHHCRLCGYSFCQPHSSCSHSLPHLGYDPEVLERVCDQCKHGLLEQNLAERVAWRLARCRDFDEGNLTPYFEIGLDSASDVALRLTKAAIALAKSIPLGAQATVAVETVDVLRKYGLHGIYGIMLRQEFLAAADLLRRALGINKTAWPLSVHELSAAIFYALVQHRAIRGLNPEHEENIHRLRSGFQRTQQQNLNSTNNSSNTTTWADTYAMPSESQTRTSIPSVIDNFEVSALSFHNNPVLDQTDTYHPEQSTFAHLQENFDATGHDPRISNSSKDHSQFDSDFEPVCDPVPDNILLSLIFYAPIALNFIYAEKEVDMQLLAAQQGWRLLYAYLEQDKNSENMADRPASALFLHQESKIVCLSIRGTATIHDVVTDIRQEPVAFPDQDIDQCSKDKEQEWTSVFEGQGLALCGMASAAANLFREHIDSLMHFAKQGYRIRITGHSLGGAVATMLGVLVMQHLEREKDIKPNLPAENLASLEDGSLLKVYAYGTPSCVDAKLADSVKSFVTTVILHDDVFPRLTPTSCRGLLKHLLHIRETWVKAHIEEDLRAVGERAKTVWAPKFRQSFTLKSSSSIKKYCKNQFQKGKNKLLLVNSNTPHSGNEEINEEERPSADTGSFTSEQGDWGEKFFVPTAESISPSFNESFEGERDDTDAEQEDRRSSNEHPLLLEFLGGIDTQTEGVVIDGDEFFDSEDKLIESDDEETVATDCFREPMSSSIEYSLAASDSWSVEPVQKPQAPAHQSAESSSEEAEPSAVVLDEIPLPRMFVPGKIIHMYSHRGVYKAAYVPRNFRELRRISLAGNMLFNHSTKSYYEGLLEVQTARAAPERPPRWTAFDEDNTCSCCAHRFTWASTSDSEAQEARDKHNCRSCGGLVCDPCAKHRVPIPSIGLTVPVRVCDRCYHDMGGHSVASSSLTGSFLGVDEEEHPSRDDLLPPNQESYQLNDSLEDRPERRREKRSLIVDELASQMRTTVLTS